MFTANSNILFLRISLQNVHSLKINLRFFDGQTCMLNQYSTWAANSAIYIFKHILLGFFSCYLN